MQPARTRVSLVQNNIDYESDCTIEYDLETYMESDDGSSVSNILQNMPADMNELIRQVTPTAWFDNPLPRSQHVATDNYSPASPVYDPDSDHSLIQIASNEEEGPSMASMSPAQLDVPIVTPASDIFDTDNSDSDMDFEGEVEG